MRRLLAPCAALALGLALACSGAGAGLGAATAEPLADARARAGALRAELDDLRLRTALAVEDYDTAQDELARLVRVSFAARESLEQARAAAAGRDAVRRSRVRRLYASGGPAALYSTVLDAASPTDALRGVHNAQQLMAVDARQAADDSRADVELAAGTSAQVAAAEAQVREAQRVDALVGAVQTLLERSTRLLADADADVARIAQEQAAAAERLAEAAFSAQLAALPSGTPAAPSPAVAGVLDAARAELGKPYVWGATGPDAFDCSGLTGWAYAAAGVHLPRTSRQQYLAGPHPSVGDLLPGDLLFWGSDPATIHHVALYLGGGRMIAAPHTGENVQIQAVYSNGYLGATRVL